jgi:glyoxylase-like metal-dependent hydrolase (beta-lactamase superfamily II)
MLNVVYLVGDRETGEAVAVDPAHAPDDVLDLLEADGMRLTGVLATHYHPRAAGAPTCRVATPRPCTTA